MIKKINFLGIAVLSGLILSCGVKKPPAPLYTTPLPFEESTTSPKNPFGTPQAAPTAFPTPTPLSSPGKKSS